MIDQRSTKKNVFVDFKIACSLYPTTTITQTEDGEITQKTASTFKTRTEVFKLDIPYQVIASMSALFQKILIIMTVCHNLSTEIPALQHRRYSLNACTIFNFQNGQRLKGFGKVAPTFLCL